MSTGKENWMRKKLENMIIEYDWTSEKSMSEEVTLQERYKERQRIIN